MFLFYVVSLFIQTKKYTKVIFFLKKKTCKKPDEHKRRIKQFFIKTNVIKPISGLSKIAHSY